MNGPHLRSLPVVGEGLLLREPLLVQGPQGATLPLTLQATQCPLLPSMTNTLLSFWLETSMMDSIAMALRLATGVNDVMGACAGTITLSACACVQFRRVWGNCLGDNIGLPSLSLTCSRPHTHTHTHPHTECPDLNQLGLNFCLFHFFLWLRPRWVVEITSGNQGSVLQ